jgi:hypothetical protein
MTKVLPSPGVHKSDPIFVFCRSSPGYSISIDKANQKIMALDVSTSVDDPKQKVVFNINCSNLPDGTQYPGKTTLDAQAKNLKIVIENAGFKNAAGK